jgi:murein DD-endopeptidase MepM/ murein hydrolase activator NlpD
VDRGQLIGYLGATGEASAPHLHLEVWKEGVAVDPRVLFPGDPPR